MKMPAIGFRDLTYTAGGACVALLVASIVTALMPRPARPEPVAVASPAPAQQLPEVAAAHTMLDTAAATIDFCDSFEKNELAALERTQAFLTAASRAAGSDVELQKEFRWQFAQSGARTARALARIEALRTQARTRILREVGAPEVQPFGPRP